MSYFDQASLVMIPSGYKTSKVYSVKPTDGSGDMVVTRSNDTATRVGPDGLIEKVRTNLLTYSNTFSNAAWQVVGAPTLTANYDTNPLTGANDAWRFQSPSISDRIFQAFSGSFHNFSLYAKGTGTIRLRDSSGTYGFNMVLTSSWQRASVHIAASFGNVQITSDGGCDATIYAAQLETGDIATDYIATTSAAVSVGPVANVPRLDYLNSSCPRLLLEPQRTNSVLWSEQLDNAYHTKNQASVTANNAVSPDGYTNADKLIPNTTSTDDHRLSGGTLTVTSGAAYTTSVFAKNGGYNVCSVRAANGGTVQVNLTTGAKTEYGSVTSSSVVDYGNGWYRISVTANASSTSYAPAILVQNSTASQYPIWAGNGTDGILLYGFMTEAGAYATSYIPTLGAAVTRGADAASKTGISSLIGQTQGTIYLEADIQKYAETGFSIAISDGATLANAIYLNRVASGNLQVLVRKSGNPDGTIIISSANWTAGLNKVAIAYTATTAEVFVNGSSKGTVSFISAPTCSQFAIGSRPDSLGTSVGTGPYSQALLFKTRLTNAQLAELTTI